MTIVDQLAHIFAACDLDFSDPLDESRSNASGDRLTHSLEFRLLVQFKKVAEFSHSTWSREYFARYVFFIASKAWKL